MHLINNYQTNVYIKVMSVRKIALQHKTSYLNFVFEVIRLQLSFIVSVAQNSMFITKVQF